MKNYFYLLGTFLFFNFAFGQDLSENWKVDYSKRKVFVENVGQFDEFENASTGDIHYAVDFGFSRIYFGEKGVSYSFLQIKKKSREERDQIMNEASKTFDRHRQKEALIGKHLIREDQVNFEWKSAKKNVEISGVGLTSDYHGYTFTDENGESRNVSKVRAFEKILYKNIYPQIDIE